MTNTPRTDAYVEFWLKDRLALWPDFARTLELELTQLKNEYASKIRLDQGVDGSDAGQRHHATDASVRSGSRQDQDGNPKGPPNIHAS